jgi:hypothetical protein
VALSRLSSVLKEIEPAIGPIIGGRHTTGKIIVVESVGSTTALPVAKAAHHLTALQLYTSQAAQGGNPAMFLNAPIIIVPTAPDVEKREAVAEASTSPG